MGRAGRGRSISKHCGPSAAGRDWDRVHGACDVQPLVVAKTMKTSNFVLLSEQPLRLFYTGAHLFGTKLSVSTRETVSRALGSACRVFMLLSQSSSKENG